MPPAVAEFTCKEAAEGFQKMAHWEEAGKLSVLPHLVQDSQRMPLAGVARLTEPIFPKCPGAG